MGCLCEPVKALRRFEMSETVYPTTQRNIPEELKLQTNLIYRRQVDQGCPTA
jgi:hypothetical protein